MGQNAHWTHSFTKVAVLLLLLPGCRNEQLRQDNLPKTEQEADQGTEDRRAFVVFAGGTRVGAIIQEGERFVSRAGGQYLVYDDDGRFLGYLLGDTGEVFDYRGPENSQRKVDTVDVTHAEGLARGAEQILQLSPGSAKVTTAGQAQLPDAVKGSNKK